MSYVHPVSLRRSAGAVNEQLEILLYCNRLQLACRNALYSDGEKYIPATALAADLKRSLPHIKSVLVLGAGLASIVSVLRRKKCDPVFTLVEMDKVVLKWAMEFTEHPAHIRPVCMDAAGFMQQNTSRFDLVFIDIFDDLSVPEFVYSDTFLQQCRDALLPGGHVALNYIVHNPQKWALMQATFSSVFPGYRVVNASGNKLLIYKREA